MFARAGVIINLLSERDLHSICRLVAEQNHNYLTRSNRRANVIPLDHHLGLRMKLSVTGRGASTVFTLPKRAGFREVGKMVDKHLILKAMSDDDLRETLLVELEVEELEDRITPRYTCFMPVP